MFDWLTDWMILIDLIRIVNVIKAASCDNF